MRGFLQSVGAGTAEWRLFSHLYPPRSLAGPEGEAVLDWRTTFHMNKCGYRRGTGFVDVTDLRHGKQRRVIMRKVHRGKLASLLDGAPAADFRHREIEAFAKSGLVHQVDGSDVPTRRTVGTCRGRRTRRRRRPEPVRRPVLDH
ncbi:DUF5825 family protein [Streptomyces sp. NPDC058308]|uniref:DUF5825 family protein n=1 Tax=Streptomyces sp. NPDC058308 TaxID=3346440 RepID=UPI0036E51185